MSSRRAAGILPEVKSSAVRPGVFPGRVGRSTPASAAATGSRAAKPKSGTTNPRKPPPCLRSPSVAGFWQTRARPAGSYLDGDEDGSGAPGGVLEVLAGQFG